MVELPPDPAEPTKDDAQFMDDVATVLRSQQNEPALSSDGVCLFLGPILTLGLSVGVCVKISIW